MKTNPQAKYRKKCKTKLIVFYPNEMELYEYAKSINFQKSVKQHLKEQYTKDIYKGVSRYGN